MSEPLVGLAQWAIRQENWDKAVEYLDESLEISPDSPNIIYFKAVVQLEGKKWNDFTKTLEAFRRIQSGNPLLKYLEGRHLILKKEWLKGSRMLAEVRQQVELLQPQLLDMLDRSLAVAYQQLGQSDLQLEALNNLVSRQPDDIDLRLLRMQCLLGLRQEARALGDYEYVEDLLKADPEQAQRRVADRLRYEMIKQERLPEPSRDWRKAIDLGQALAANSNVNRALKQALLTDLARMTGQEDAANADAASGALGQLIARLGEIQRDIFRKPLDEVMQELDAFEEEVGHPVLQVRLLRGEAIAYHKPDNAQALLRELEEVPESFNEQQRRLWQVDLGRFYAQAGLQDEANRLWSQVLADDPNDIQLRLRLFELTLASGDESATSQALDGIEKSVGRNSPEWKWARASHLAAQVRAGSLPPGRLENAMSLITEAKNSRGNWAQLYLLQGDIDLLRDNPEAAIESFERARRLGSDNPDALRNLVGIYYQRQQFDEARAALERLPQPLWSNRERQIQLHLLAMRGELPEDLDLEGMATDAESYIWLGRLMTDAGRQSDAERAYRMALELQPESPLAWVGLLTMKLRFDDKPGAASVLDEAKEAVPPHAKTSFLATGYRLLGDFENAETYYKQLLDEHPDKTPMLQDVASFYLQFQHPDEARPIVDKILAAENSADALGAVRWARRVRRAISRPAIAMKTTNRP